MIIDHLAKGKFLKRLLKAFPWLLAVALVALVVRSVPLGEAWAALRGLTVWTVLVLVVMNGLVLVSLNGRWWVILWGLGYRLPFWRLLGHRLAAFGVSYFTPGPHFGGEPVQVLLVEREHGVPRTTAVAAVTLDKTLELLVNFTFLLGGVTAVLQSQLFGSMVGGEAMLFAVGMLALPVLLLVAIWRDWQPITRLVGWVAEWHWWEKRPLFQQKLHRWTAGIQNSESQASQLFQQSPGSLWAAFGISIVGWLLIIVEYWFMIRFLGINLSALQTIAMLTAARIAILLPLPGGLGTLEASQVLALSAMGLNTGVGLSISLLIRVRDVLLGLVGLWWGVRHLNLNFLRQKQHPSPTNGVMNSNTRAYKEPTNY